MAPANYRFPALQVIGSLIFLVLASRGAVVPHSITADTQIACSALTDNDDHIVTVAGTVTRIEITNCVLTGISLDFHIEDRRTVTSPGPMLNIAIGGVLFNTGGGLRLLGPGGTGDLTDVSLGLAAVQMSGVLHGASAFTPVGDLAEEVTIAAAMATEIHATETALSVIAGNVKDISISTNGAAQIICSGSAATGIFTGSVAANVVDNVMLKYEDSGAMQARHQTGVALSDITVAAASSVVPFPGMTTLTGSLVCVHVDNVDAVVARLDANYGATMAVSVGAFELAGSGASIDVSTIVLTAVDTTVEADQGLVSSAVGIAGMALGNVELNCNDPYVGVQRSTVSATGFVSSSHPGVVVAAGVGVLGIGTNHPSVLKVVADVFGMKISSYDSTLKGLGGLSEPSAIAVGGVAAIARNFAAGGDTVLEVDVRGASIMAAMGKVDGEIIYNGANDEAALTLFGVATFIHDRVTSSNAEAQLTVRAENSYFAVFSNDVELIVNGKGVQSIAGIAGHVSKEKENERIVATIVASDATMSVGGGSGARLYLKDIRRGGAAVGIVLCASKGDVEASSGTLTVEADKIQLSGVGFDARAEHPPSPSDTGAAAAVLGIAIQWFNGHASSFQVAENMGLIRVRYARIVVDQGQFSGQIFSKASALALGGFAGRVGGRHSAGHDSRITVIADDTIIMNDAPVQAVVQASADASYSAIAMLGVAVMSDGYNLESQCEAHASNMGIRSASFDGTILAPSRTSLALLGVASLASSDGNEQARSNIFADNFNVDASFMVGLTIAVEVGDQGIAAAMIGLAADAYSGSGAGSTILANNFQMKANSMNNLQGQYSSGSPGSLGTYALVVAGVAISATGGGTNLITSGWSLESCAGSVSAASGWIFNKVDSAAGTTPPCPPLVPIPVTPGVPPPLTPLVFCTASPAPLQSDGVPCSASARCLNSNCQSKCCKASIVAACTNCDSLGDCTACASTHFLDNKNCVLKYAPGASCSVDGECGSGKCLSSFCCVATWNAACQTCAATTGNCATCSATHYSDVTCKLLEVTGQSCTADSQCADSNCQTTCCKPTLVAACNQCDGSGDCTACASTHYVDNKNCVIKKTDGTSCSADGECGTNVCLGTCCSAAHADCTTCGAGGVCTICASTHFLDGSNACQAKVAAGASCSADEECGSGKCLGSFCCTASSASCAACNSAGACMQPPTSMIPGPTPFTPGSVPTSGTPPAPAPGGGMPPPASPVSTFVTTTSASTLPSAGGTVTTGSSQTNAVTPPTMAGSSPQGTSGPLSTASAEPHPGAPGGPATTTPLVVSLPEIVASLPAERTVEFSFATVATNAVLEYLTIEVSLSAAIAVRIANATVIPEGRGSCTEQNYQMVCVVPAVRLSEPVAFRFVVAVPDYFQGTITATAIVASRNSGGNQNRVSATWRPNYGSSGFVQQAGTPSPNATQLPPAPTQAAAASSPLLARSTSRPVRAIFDPTTGTDVLFVLYTLIAYGAILAVVSLYARGLRGQTFVRPVEQPLWRFALSQHVWVSMLLPCDARCTALHITDGFITVMALYTSVSALTNVTADSGLSDMERSAFAILLGGAFALVPRCLLDALFNGYGIVHPPPRPSDPSRHLRGTASECASQHRPLSATARMQLEALEDVQVVEECDVEESHGNNNKKIEEDIVVLDKRDDANSPGDGAGEEEDDLDVFACDKLPVANPSRITVNKYRFLGWFSTVVLAFVLCITTVAGVKDHTKEDRAAFWRCFGFSVAAIAFVIDPIRLALTCVYRWMTWDGYDDDENECESSMPTDGLGSSMVWMLRWFHAHEGESAALAPAIFH